MSRSFDAAIFDLFGTLVPEFPRADFYASVRAAARVLGCDEEAFLEGWTRTAIDRQTGRFDVADNVRAIVAALGHAPPTPETLEEALAPRRAMYERWFHPRVGALEALRALRERGYPVGLISMCAPDAPALWRASPLAPLVDVTVFSSESGLRKPDPAIYRACVEALGVEAPRCLYCGDGSYRELSGAEAVGMTAVEIRDPAVDHAEQLRPEAEEWSGARVGDLRELLVYFPAG
ncbi:MAG: HAD family hydrolase [Planctomycetaceae bacterium]